MLPIMSVRRKTLTSSRYKSAGVEHDTRHGVTVVVTSWGNTIVLLLLHLIISQVKWEGKKQVPRSRNT
jgi:hypothetical protein